MINTLQNNAKGQLRSRVCFGTALILLGFGLVPAIPADAQILNETFDTDALKDVAATTADWDTTSGSLKLPLATSPSPIQALDNPFTALSASSPIDLSENSTRTVSLGDLDGDGDLDVFFGNNGANQVYFNDGFGSFSLGSPIPNTNDQFGGNTRSSRIADFNGDGHLDVVVAEFGGGRFNRVLFNNGSGGPTIFDVGDFADLGPQSLSGDSIAVGDVDNDGDADIVIGVENNYVQLFLNDGFGEFSDAIAVVDAQAAGGFHARSVALADLDRDGNLDLVAALEFDTTSIYLGDGNGGFTFQGTAGGGAVNRLRAPDSMSIGDLNGDGFLDIVIGNDGSDPINGEPNRIYINSGVVANMFPAALTFETDNADTNGVILVDVDRDGDLDIVTADLGSLTTPSLNRLYVNDGSATFSPPIAIGSDSNLTKSIAAGDLDGIPGLDLVMANDPETGVPGSAVNRIVFNTGTPNATNEDQLYATAKSLRVDSGEDLSNGVILDASLVAGVAAEIANPAFSYWLSVDGGSRWVSVQPGRSISFPDTLQAQELVWRVDINTISNNINWRPAVDSLQIVTNRPARIISTEVTTATQGELYTYTVNTVDPDGESVNIQEGAALPNWLTLTDNGNGTATLEGTPTNDDVGTDGNDVTIEAFDGSGIVVPSGAQAFTITVSNTNDAPAVTSPIADQTFDQGETVTIPAADAFTDADGDPLTFSAAGLPASLAIDQTTGVINGTLTNDDAINNPDPGYSVTVTADDGSVGGTAEDTFILTVNNINDAPTFTSSPETAATTGSSYTYNIVVEDIDGDSILITAGTLPAWLTLTDNGDGTAILSGTPSAGDVGSLDVALSADDSQVEVQQLFTIAIGAANVPPTITITGDNPAEVQQGSTYTDAGATASDPEDGDLTASIVVDNSVDTSAIGTYTVTYTVTDSGGLTAESTRTVNVVAANTAPTITITGDNPIEVDQGTTYNDAGATADDAEDGDLTAAIVVDSNVDTSTAGSYTVTYTVTDSGGLTAEASRTVTVVAPPPPPPPPRSSGGGGGSLDLLLLLVLSSVAIFAAARRRRLDSR